MFSDASFFSMGRNGDAKVVFFLAGSFSESPSLQS
jgi:hypothetical protein